MDHKDLIFKDHARVKPYLRVVIDDPDVGEPEIRLWRSVVMQAVSDALDPNERIEIIRWIPSKDFEEVCGNASLDPVKLGGLLAKIVLGKKPESIVNANRLKMMIWHGSLDMD